MVELMMDVSPVTARGSSLKRVVYVHLTLLEVTARPQFMVILLRLCHDGFSSK